MNHHTLSGVLYDAATVSRILGLPCESSAPVPEAENREVVVYYGGWNLQQLRTCAVGKNRMWQDQTWYEKHGWKAEPGYYRLLLSVPGSNRKTWSEQIAHLRTIDPAWQAAPIVIAATALLVHLVGTGTDLLRNGWCRCVEALPGDDRGAGLIVHYGRVFVDSDWDDDPSGSVWLAAARKVP